MFGIESDERKSPPTGANEQEDVHEHCSKGATRMREEDARCKGLIQGLVGIEQCPSIFVDRSARSETNGGGAAW